MDAQYLYAVILHDDCEGCTPEGGIDEACRRCELWAHAAGLDECADCAHVYPLPPTLEEGSVMYDFEAAAYQEAVRQADFADEYGQWEN